MTPSVWVCVNVCLRICVRLCLWVCDCLCLFLCFCVCVSMRMFVSETRCPGDCLSGSRSVGRCVCGTEWVGGWLLWQLLCELFSPDWTSRTKTFLVRSSNMPFPFCSRVKKKQSTLNNRWTLFSWRACVYVMCVCVYVCGLGLCVFVSVWITVTVCVSLCLVRVWRFGCMCEGVWVTL